MTGKHFHLVGKRYARTEKDHPISESAQDFATQMIIFPIPLNPSLWGLSPKFGRIGQHGRETFPPGKRSAWPANATQGRDAFSRFRETRQTLRPK